MPSLTKIPLQIASYNILLLSLPPLPSFPQPATHYLYFAPHKPKIPTPTASRSLFLINIPFDATELHLKHLFSTQIDLPVGRIEEIQLGGQRRNGGSSDEAKLKQDKKGKKGKKRKWGSDGGSLEGAESVVLPSTWDRDVQSEGLTAVVLFVDQASMSAALKAAKALRKEHIEPVWGEGMEDRVPALGSARYLKHHKLTYPNKSQLLESVNNSMISYAAKEASQARLAAKQRQEADADGFITVTRGGRTNPTRQEVAQEVAKKQKEKQKGLEDFYRFQSREKRKERARELMRKFAEDKDRVRKMKERRGRFRASLPVFDMSQALNTDPRCTARVTSKVSVAFPRQPTTWRALKLNDINTSWSIDGTLIDLTPQEGLPTSLAGEAEDRRLYVVVLPLEEYCG